MGLQTTGELVHICSETLIQADINTENRYKDFVAIPQYANGHHIIAVTEINELGTSHIQLINCFGFDIIFSLNLTHNSFLITPESVDDEIVYITKIMQNDRLKELQFTRIYETSPEKRLTKLLKKGCLEDAESFAKLYNLDMNIIRKARAQAIVDKTVCNEADIDALLELLNTIKDLQFTLQCCLDVHSCCERLEDVKRVLKYGCSELPSDLVTLFWTNKTDWILLLPLITGQWWWYLCYVWDSIRFFVQIWYVRRFIKQQRNWIRLQRMVWVLCMWSYPRNHFQIASCTISICEFRCNHCNIFLF